MRSFKSIICVRVVILCYHTVGLMMAVVLTHLIGKENRFLLECFVPGLYDGVNDNLLILLDFFIGVLIVALAFGVYSIIMLLLYSAKLTPYQIRQTYKKRRTPMKVIYSYGPPGVGKTYHAYRQLKEAEAEGLTVIILDDVYEIPSLDGYECDILIITSNLPPPDDVKDRIDECYYWDKC